MHTMHFNQILPHFPYLSHHSSLPHWCAFILNPLNSLRTAYIHTGIGPSAGAWMTSQGSLPEENELSNPQKLLTASSSSVWNSAILTSIGIVQALEV